VFGVRVALEGLRINTLFGKLASNNKSVLERYQGFDRNALLIKLTPTTSHCPSDPNRRRSFPKS
jgi:hypothetical protein